MAIWTEERLKYLREQTGKRVPALTLAEKYGISRARLYQVLAQYGIDPPERRRETRRLSPHEYRLWKTLQALKCTAKRKGHPFTVKLEDFYPLPQHCPVFGTKLNYEHQGIRDENSPSFDRLNPALGYVKGNVVLMSWRANRIKNDGTAEEHKQIADFLHKYPPPCNS